jgi:5-methylcytosine-specific restriction endonuclease McrA
MSFHTQKKVTKGSTGEIKNPLTPRKATIPAAIREQIWLRQFGKVFEGKCPVAWCQNMIDVYNFESGHNIPESKGGKTTPDNLIPICSRCNKSMGNRYTITEWSSLGKPVITDIDIEQNKQKVKSPWWVCCAIV